MGAILSAPCACLGSCLGSCAATAACRSLGSSMSTSRGAKLFYVVIVFLSALLALLARYASGSLFQRMDLFSMASCVSAGCFQVHAAFRICIAVRGTDACRPPTTDLSVADVCVLRHHGCHVSCPWSVPFRARPFEAAVLACAHRVRVPAAEQL